MQKAVSNMVNDLSTLGFLDYSVNISILAYAQVEIFCQKSLETPLGKQISFSIFLFSLVIPSK